MGGKSDGPDVPSSNDFRNMAIWQSDIDREMMREQLQANRPAQYSPWGSVTWEQGPNDQWTQTIGLPDTMQEALEAQQGLGLARSELGAELIGPIREQLTSPYGWDPLSANEVLPGEEARNAAEEAIYSRATSRLDPYWNQQTSQRETQLWNQGLRPGDEAWDTAMGNLGRARTDAYQTAMNEAVMGGGREAERMFGMDIARRQQAVTEALRQRTQGLGELNTVMGGQGVAPPQFPSFSRMGQAQAPDLLGAAQMGYQAELDRYNAEQAREQGLWSGITGLASTFAPMVPWQSIGQSVWNLF